MKLALVAVFVLGACDDGDSGRTIAVDDVPTEVASLVCAQLFDCCTTTEFMDETFGADTVAECEALYSGFANLIVTTLKDSIAKGRVIYHGDRLAACYDRLADASCVEYRSADQDSFEGCDSPFEPKVANAGECGEDFDCTSGFCDGESIDFETQEITYGVCVTAPTAGQACIDSDCATGLYCDSGTCAAPQADGAACNDDDECASRSCNGTGIDGGRCGAIMTCDGQ
ncbi:MAG: hypothetical protein WKG01_42290 [Kofleriaceae bacterium]